MPENENDSKGKYSPVTDYVTALKGDEFQELDSNKVWNIAKIAVAEVLGTAIFVGIGCGSVVLFPGATPDHMVTVFSFAFAVNVAITAFGHLSGAYINPSLALTSMILGKMSFPMFLVYTVSDCLGAFLGSAAVKAISPSECIVDSFCLTLPNPSINVYQALLAELFMTFCLAIVLCSALDDRSSGKQDSMALKFAFTVAALALAGGKYTGCSMNPARSFGPAFLSGNWTQHWVYWVGPLTGAALAGFLYQVFFVENTRPRKKSDSAGLETLQA